MLPGYRFHPTDEELAGHYLYKKLTGKLFAAEETIVSDCQLYGREEPWEVWKRFGGDGTTDVKDLYFFTELKKKALQKKKNKQTLITDDSRIDRSVGTGEGNWHREDSGKNFDVTATADFDCSIKIEATKKRFKYKNRNSSHHCGWILFEYSLPDLNRELVLCRLRKNGSKTGGNNKSKRKIDDYEDGEVVNFEMVMSDNKRIKANDNEVVSNYNQTRANGDDDCMIIASDFDDQMGTEFWANNQVGEQQVVTSDCSIMRTNRDYGSWVIRSDFDSPLGTELRAKNQVGELEHVVSECNNIWAPGGDECLTVGADRDEPMAPEFSVEELLDNANTFEFAQINDGDENEDFFADVQKFLGSDSDPDSGSV